MKRLCYTLLCVIILVGLVVPARAVDCTNMLEQVTVEEEISIGNEVVVTGEGTTPFSSSSITIPATKTKKYSKNGKVIASISVTAEFSYNGTSVKVVSKKISKKALYDGWSFVQSSFTSSGGTVSLKGRLEKSGVSPITVSITLTCDKNGEIS